MFSPRCTLSSVACVRVRRIRINPFVSSVQPALLGYDASQALRLIEAALPVTGRMQRHGNHDGERQSFARWGREQGRRRLIQRTRQQGSQRLREGGLTLVLEAMNGMAQGSAVLPQRL